MPDHNDYMASRTAATSIDDNDVIVGIDGATGLTKKWPGTLFATQEELDQAILDTAGLTPEILAGQLGSEFPFTIDGEPILSWDAEDGIVARLQKAHFYGNNPKWHYEAGDPFFRISDYGNIYGGPNPWVIEDDNGSPKALKRDGSGSSGQQPFQHDLVFDLHADTSYLGRRWFVGDTNDPVDAVIQRSDGPISVVSGGSLGSPYVIGWDPIDIPVDSLGTSAALSGWGTRGKAGLKRRLVFDAADAFEHLQANNFTYDGLDFSVGAHKLTGCVGERYTVLNTVTLDTITGQDVIIEFTTFRNETKGRLIKDGGTVSFTRQSIGSTTFGGEPAKVFTGCKAASGTITLNPGDHIYAYFKFGATENVTPEIDPQPAPALPGELPSWWSNTQAGAGIGRLCWRGLVIPAGGVSGVDAASAWSPYLAAIWGEAAEDLFSNAAGGRLSLRTNPYGGTGMLPRVTVEPLGQLQALAGFSLGEPKELAVGTNLNSATPALGRVGQYAYTNVSPLEYDIVVGAAMSIAVNTTTAGDATHNEVETFAITGAVAGDQFTVRFNGETSAPIDYDTDLTTGHNAAAAAVFRAALESLPSSNAGDFLVTRAVAGGVTTFTVTFGSLITASGSRFKVTNTVATTITNLAVTGESAIDGQILSVRFMNTNTTLKHNNAGVGKIWLRDAQDRAMSLNETILLIYDANYQGFFELGPRVRLAGLTANRALVSDASGVAIASATVSDTELGYLDGVTSALQTQLDAKQPLDSDLTSIAALATTAYGRGFLTLADQAALVALLPSYQPLDSDLTSIAALATTAFGRAFLTEASAYTTRSTIGLSRVGNGRGAVRTQDPANIASGPVLGASNRGHYIRLQGSQTGVTAINIMVQVQSGNICVGIFPNNGSEGIAARPSGNRKATTGSIACPATGYQSVNFLASVDIDDGDWVHIVADNNTAAFGRTAAPIANAAGAGVVYYEDSSFPSPSSVGTLVAGINVYWAAT